MTRDDIIRMAQEASAVGDGLELSGDAIERFAALVAAAEREACAKVVEGEVGKFQTSAARFMVANAIRKRGAL